MPRRISDEIRFDVGIAPFSRTTGNTTGRYYKVDGYHNFLAILQTGAVALTKKAKIELIQATSAAGAGAKAVTGAPLGEAVGGVLDTAETLTLATVLAAEAITINGLVFTAHATVTNKSLRQFSIGGDDTVDAAALASCINDPQYGVPGVLATPAAAVITLVPASRYGKAITCTTIPSTITVACTETQAYAEATIHAMDLAGGFKWIACKVTTDATILVGATLLRSHAKHSPVQAVGAGLSV